VTSKESEPELEPRGSGCNASRIVPGLYIGGWRDAATFAGFRISVLDPGERGVPCELQLAIFADGDDAALPARLDEVADRIARARAEGHPVLIFCGQGARRSVLATAWYLTRREGQPFAEAIAMIRRARPRAESPLTWLPALPPPVPGGRSPQAPEGRPSRSGG
jgi:hypothetical protein